MGRKKKQPESGRDRPGKNVNAWLPDPVVDAFHKLCVDEKRTKAAQLEILIVEGLSKRGRWPVSPQAGAQGGAS
jgi:hypothetical protein